MARDVVLFEAACVRGGSNLNEITQRRNELSTSMERG
jgi:hypothetical protein